MNWSKFSVGKLVGVLVGKFLTIPLETIEYIDNTEYFNFFV